MTASEIAGPEGNSEGSRAAIMTAEQARDPDHFPGFAVAVPLGIQHVLALSLIHI